MLTKAIYKNMFRVQLLYLWAIVTILFWLCLSVLMFSQNHALCQIGKLSDVVSEVTPYGIW